jgi:acetate kinase
VRVLAVNTGSSSVKLSLLGHDDERLAEHQLDAPATDLDAAAFTDALRELGDADVVAHRFVHGAGRRDAVILDDAVEAELASLVTLAPLHQPKALAAVAAIRPVLPDVPEVACFDTAFHAGMPAEAATYAVPRAWRERFGLRRFGFHGLSHAYASRRAQELLGQTGALRLVTCHLGAGASVAAVVEGRSVDTTMGFTPLEGIVMATRSGSVDPGMLLWLQQHGSLTLDELATGLEHGSGLTALAGTGDMRTLLSRDDDDARLALDVYCHRLAGAVASMATAARGLDAVVFTGGVGENAAPIRAAVADRLGFLGMEVDRERNAAGMPDTDVSAPGAPVRTLIVAAREDVEMARGARAALASQAL